jgi:hypothetical protein
MRYMRSGNSMLRRFDAAGQLNSMFYGALAQDGQLRSLRLRMVTENPVLRLLQRSTVA